MAKPEFDDLLNISFKLNEAILHQSQWNDALQHMANVFNGSFATFELIDKKTRRHYQHHDSSELEIQDMYLGYYMPKNPRIAFGNQPNSPEILHDALFISEKEMDHNEFYADFLQPNDLRYCIGYKAYETPEEIGYFTIQKSPTSGPADEHALLAIKSLAPTLTRVANLQSKHHKLLAQIHNLESMFEAFNEGVLLLNRTGSIVSMNHIAAEILDSNDGLTLLQNKPSCIDIKYDDRLGRLISPAADIESLQVEKHFLVPRPSGLPPYQISAQSIVRTEIPLSESDARTLLIIRDPARLSSIEIDSLMDCFGFTRAEASVSLAIARGKSAQEIALSTSTSLATIRTQIQRVMQKMYVNRQSEVVRIISQYL